MIAGAAGTCAGAGGRVAVRTSDADQLGMAQGELLGDHPAHRQADHDGRAGAGRAQHVGGVVGHRPHRQRARHGARPAGAAVVDAEDTMRRGEPVDEHRRPHQARRGPPVEQQHRGRVRRPVLVPPHRRCTGQRRANGIEEAPLGQLLAPPALGDRGAPVRRGGHRVGQAALLGDERAGLDQHVDRRRVQRRAGQLVGVAEREPRRPPGHPVRRGGHLSRLPRRAGA